MPGWSHPRTIIGATSREQNVHDRAFHLADSFDDPGRAKPIRDVLDLLAELIESRGQRRDFDEAYDRPHGDD